MSTLTKSQRIFVETLIRMGGHASNPKLRRHLGWDHGFYNSIRAALITEGRIKHGRGRGGSVSLIDIDDEFKPRYF